MIKNKNRWRLERRVNQLEHQIKVLSEAHDEGRLVHETEAAAATFKDEMDGNVKSSSVRELLKGEETLTAPWLFSCQTATPLSAIQVLLEFTPDCTQELDSRLWTREEDMWIALLEDLPEGFNPKPNSLLLKDLRICARKVLLQLCTAEYMLMLRGVPGREEAVSSPMTITFVAILSAAFSEAWQRVDAQRPDELGRIAIVLEGESIGSRLRCGRQKFQIEALN